MIYRGCLLFLAFYATGPTARAQLRWEETRIVLSATNFDADPTALYHFRNVGDRPIRILSADGACSCTVPTLPAEPVPPGANGSLEVRFLLGDRVGREERAIRVTTDDDPEAPAVLALVVNIHERIVLRPRLVFWRRDTAVATRSLALRPESGVAPQYGEPEVVGDGFTVRWTSADGDGRDILVTPSETTVARRAEIRVLVVIDGRRRVLTAFAVVQ